MKKIISLLLSLAVLLSMFSYPSNVSAESIQNETQKKQYVISNVVDTSELKEILIVYPEDESYYKITATKNSDNTYNWITVIGDSQNIYNTTSLNVNRFSPKFSMQTLADTIVTSNQQMIKRYYDANVVFNSEELMQPMVIPLIAIGIYGLSATAIAAIEAAMVGTLAVATAAAVSEVLNDKKATTTSTFAAETSTVTMPRWSEFEGIPTSTTTSALKHMESALISTIATRIKNNNNSNNNLEVFTSSTNVKGSVMVVYDVKTSTRGLVNRHLGNTLGGTKVDSTVADETLDLNGYTVFLVYNHTTQKIFHAHFVPTNNRAKELSHNRYLYKYDIQIYPNFSRNTEYLENNGRSDSEQLKWEQRYKNSKTSRNNTLGSDKFGNKSVVPKI